MDRKKSLHFFTWLLTWVEKIREDKWFERNETVVGWASERYKVTCRMMLLF